MADEVLIPSTLLDRHGSYYRSFSTGGPSGKDGSPTMSWAKASEALFGIGLFHKPGSSGDAYELDPGHYSAIYVISGRGTYSDSTGATGTVSAGTVFQRIPGRKHTVKVDPTVHYCEIFLAFSPWLLDPVAQILLLYQRPVVQAGLDLALIRDLVTAIDALQAARERELPRLYLHHLGLLAALFARSGSATQDDSSRQRDDWVDEACRLLAEEADGRTTLDQVARRLGLSYESFRKIFRARMGLSPGDYRIRRRMDRARELLVARGESIKEIAYELGYPNASVFSLQFKREIGVSPEHYRRRGS